MRGYWPLQTDDETGVTEYLNNVSKYVVSSTMKDPEWERSSVLSGDLEHNVRFFAGFSGWAGEQLEGEMEQDSWLTLPAKAQHAFAEEVDLWDQVTREVAGKRILETLKIREVPPDLRMN